MIPIVASRRVRAQDQAVIEGLGLPGQVLMELAGRGVAEKAQARWPRLPVLALCGPGNNGGDGYVIARWLALWGHEVRLWASGPPATPEAAANALLCQRMGLPLLDELPAPAGPILVVDALLGTGQSRPPQGRVEEGVRWARLARGQGATVLAVDLPTGLSTDTGQAPGAVVEADLTVALGRLKPGLLHEPGASLAGEVEVVDIGLDLAALVDSRLGPPDAALLEAADLLPHRPRRRAGQAKWDGGHVAILAGGGAAVLCAHGAFRMGAGLVTLLCPRTEWDRLQGLWPEVILAEPSALDPKRHDVLVVGPGLGRWEPERVLRLWSGFPGPMVADADALTLFAERSPSAPAERVRLLTPHSAEAGRLLGLSRAEVEADRFAALRALEGYGLPILKGRNTLIGGGPVIWVNPTGSPRLASAGSGDVLAGALAALLAQRVPPREAAAMAVWCHGRAGERMPEGGSARDLLAGLSVDLILK